MSTEVTIPAALENPWPGLAPYTEQQSGLFFGREEETEELLRLIQRETLTILFGRSGSGKSSLLHAGVIPRLRSGMYFPVILRLNFADLDVDPAGQVKAITLAAARECGLEIDSGANSAPAATLWEFFHGTDFWGPRNDRLTPLLIFDQFEEAFTIGKDQRQASDFLEQLADLAENRVPLAVEERIKQAEQRVAIDAGSPAYKIILSLREDFVSRLDQLRPILPAIMRNRMGLLPLDGARALRVIANSGKPWVSEAVGRDIVAALAGETEAPTGAIERAEIEPAYLSVMCHELFRRMIELGQQRITGELVANERGEILEAMYERSFEGLAGPVRLFVEDRLLTASGFRGTIPLSESVFEGISLRDLEILVDRRLLRFEDRLGTRHVELSHDLLTGVVKKSRELRAERVARENDERKQQGLRRALLRARRRTIIAAAAAVLAFGGVAYSFFYWLAYIHPTSGYYMSFSGQLGAITPWGKLDMDAVRHRKQSVKITRKGFRGEILSLESVDSVGEPTMANSYSSMLNTDQSSSDLSSNSKYCRLEFHYDRDTNGTLVYETAWNLQHNMVWSLMFVPAQRQGDSPRARNASYFGPDGLPEPQRPGSKAQVIHVDFDAQGRQTLKYLTLDGKPVPGPDNAYGKEFVYDAQGRLVSSTSLDVDGRPMNDSAGNATYSNEYDHQGNVGRSNFTDAMGRPTLLNSNGYAIRTRKFDRWRNETEESYFDTDGYPVIDQSDGSHTVRYKYDDRGNVLQISYFDIYDNPIDKHSKSESTRYQRAVEEYNNANQLTRITFFDNEDNATKGFDLAPDIRVSYDAHGNISEISLFDEKGQPKIESGVHLIRMTHDDRGRLVETSYFGVDSEPVKAENGYHTERRHYDDNGRTDVLSYSDVAGSPPVQLGYSQEQQSFDRWGNVIDDRYTKTPGSKMTYEIIHTTYDEFGNPLKKCYLNADGSAATSAGVSCTESEYDARGLKIRESNFDKSGKLTADESGIARSEFSYNDKRQKTREEYFGVSGPVPGPGGAAWKPAPHLTQTEYDAAGHKTQVTEVDVSGNATITQYEMHGEVKEISNRDAQGKLKIPEDETYAMVRYEHRDQAREMITRYFGSDEKPVVGPGGCAIERQDLDAKGKSLKEACFDVNDHPKVASSMDGAAVLTYVRDTNERVTEEAAFGPDGKPIQTTGGYARKQEQYDAAGKEIGRQEWLVSGESTVWQYGADHQLTETAYYDAQGKPEAKKGDTFAVVRYEQTDKGQKTVTRYFGPDQKPVAAKNGCAIEREDRDAKGQLLKDACFDVNDHPMVSASTDGAATITYVRDKDEDVIEEAAFGPDGKPVETTDGYAHFKATEDSTGKFTQTDYFDQDGVLVLRRTPDKQCGPAGFAVERPENDCIIADASRTFLRSGPKRRVFVIARLYFKNGIAVQAQLHLGDVLLENDGISTFPGLWERFTLGPDGTRKLVFLRNGNQMNVEIPKGPLGAMVGATLSSQ